MRLKMLILGVMLGVIGGALFAISSPTLVAASGGAAGSGGSGGGGGSGGCSAGHWLACGYGWVEYNVTGSGPSDNFQNGTRWSSVVQACSPYEAQTVSVFVVLDGDGSAMGYNYERSMDGDPTRFPVWNGANRNKVDGNRATVIGNGEAEAGWSEYKAAIRPRTTNLNYGSEVSWFCSNFDKPDKWTLDGKSKVNKPTAQPGETVTFSHDIKNNGPDRARYGWRVMQNNDFVPGTNGSVQDAGVDTHHPSWAWNKFKIPDNAKNNQQYCQRIEFNNKNGPNTTGWDDGPASSTSACVTVKVPTEPTDDNTCNTVSVKSYGNYNGNATRTIVKVDNVTVKQINGSTVNEYSNIPWTGSDAAKDNDVVFDNWGGTNRKYQAVPDDNGSTTATSKRWYFVPTEDKIQVIVVQQWYKSTSPNKGWNTIPGTTPTNEVRDCGAVSCKVQEVLGTGRNDIVLAGEEVRVIVRITNNSVGEGMWLDDAYVKVAGTNDKSEISNAIPKDTYDDVTLTFDAPNSSVAWSKNLEIGVAKPGGLSGSCPLEFNVYKKYDVTAVAQTTLNNGGFSGENLEDPSNFQHTSWLDLENAPSGGSKVPYATCAYKTTSVPSSNQVRGCPAGYTYVSGTLKTQANQPKTFVNGAPSLTSPNNYALTGGEPITPNAGDVYCTYIIALGASAYVGPAGDVVSGEGTTDSLSCKTVHNKPYVKAFGKGARSTNGFDYGSGCSAATEDDSVLASWFNNSGGNKRGSGTELNAMANFDIVGFASSNGTPSPTELTFANTTIAQTTTPSPNLGGNFDGSDCSINIEAPDGTDTDTSTTPIDPGSSSGSKIYRGNRVVNGNSSFNTKQSVFVEGDVYIAGNIEYANSSTGWSGVGSTSTVPSFVLYATGNIYIAPTVTKLDGLYVAKGNKSGSGPTATINGGRIFTCGQSTFAPMDQSTLYNSCKNQLTVRGAFVAYKVNLMRTYGSLRNSTNSESPRDGTATLCSNGGNTNSCAAEVFDFSPEFYLSNPAIKNPAADTQQYDSITSLPPVL